MEFLTIRRRASPEELDQGMLEMLEEQSRLEREQNSIENQPHTPTMPKGSQKNRQEKGSGGGVDETGGCQDQDRGFGSGGKGKGNGSQREDRLRTGEEEMRTGRTGTEQWDGGPHGGFEDQRGSLFTEEQLQRMEDLRKRAPLLTGRTPEVARPSWMVEEELKIQAREAEKMRAYEQQRMLQMRKDQESLEILRRMRELEQEREYLRSQNEVLMREREDWKEKAKEGGFATPEDEKKKGEERPGETEEGEKEKSDMTNMTLRLMMKMMEKMIERDEEKKADGGGGLAETVRYGGAQGLPSLPEWSASSAPLDLGDWLTLLDSHMGDLSTTSHEWWTRVIQEAKEWYAAHQVLGPLDKVTHRPEPSPHLQQARWSRLERRASSLLLAALPESQRDEMIATKSLAPLSIVAKLMVTYQPGGLAEKSIVLRALENPEEAQSLPQAMTMLRRWLRWKRRALDVGVTLPDPSVMVWGLNKMMKKVLDGNRELNFRISLAKTNLMVESVPREETVQQLAEHLIAEVEQIAHTETRVKVEPKPIAKKFEETNDRSTRSEPKKDEICKFFTTDGGCKKGRMCKWSHVPDDQRRCWNCGAKDHFATSCPRKEGAERNQEGGKGFGDRKGGDGAKGGPRVAKAARKEEENAGGGAEGTTANSSSPPAKEDAKVEQGEAMKEMLEEANKMLRMLHKEKKGQEEGGTREGRLDRLQQQLNDLKSLKVLRMAKLQQEPGDGLLDSGATHALRGRRPGEDTSECREVQVTLACGRQTTLHMTRGGTMIHSNPATEPIVPLGRVVGKLGCRLGWDEEGLLVHHPERGRLPVEDRGGCPHIPRSLALDLIEELEEKGNAEVRKVCQLEDEEERILWELIQSHPVLASLPITVQHALVVRPAKDLKGLPETNKRRRRRLQRKGFTVHLYAGPDKDFTLKRALHEAGGDVQRLVELDEKRGSEHNMLYEQPYGSLLRAALDDNIDGVIAGPNCRTRSVLRHLPVSMDHHGPRPLRSWGEGEFGRGDLNPQEQKKVTEDDVMMWRAFFLFIVARHVREAENGRAEEKENKKGEVKLLVEQPAHPEHHPEVVSLWKTSQWRKLEEMYDLGTQTFNQGDWGGVGVPVKPTTVGGNLRIQVPSSKNYHAIPRGDRPSSNSKDLSRWVPGFMRAVAKGVVEEIEQRRPELKVLSWDEHVAHGHVPFRKDCLICQQASAKDKPHRRLGRHPRGGVLSVDTSGPLVQGEDVTGETVRFLLVGAFTWAVPRSSPLKEDVDVAEDEGQEEPLVLEGEEDGGEDYSPSIGGLEEEDESQKRNPDPEEGLDQRDKEEEKSQRKDLDPEEDLDQESEEKKDFEVKVFRLVAPMASKRGEEVLGAVADMIFRLKSDGFEVNQVHSDNGGEFCSAAMRRWMLNRGYIRTYTAGDDPQSNGRVENSVQQAKNQMRRLLRQGGMEPQQWPLAARHLNEVWRYQRIGRPQDFPPLNAEVLVRKRYWNARQLSATMEKVRYVAPNHWCHGHWVEKEGSWVTTRYVISKVQNPITDHSWIALEEQMRDPHEVRRRIRGKQAAGPEYQERERGGVLRVVRMIHEEMKAMVEEEDEKHNRATLRSLRFLRSFVEGHQEDEVLQTRIVSVSEVWSHQEEWRIPIQAELDSLLHEKEALRQLSPEEKKEFFRKAAAEGRTIEVVPGKLVPTLKPAPGGGKKKARIVACGNFTTKDSSEELYAGTGDVVTFRLMLKYAAEQRWRGVTTDIRTAFLNTPWDDEDVLVKPPAIVTKMGLVPEGVLWQPMKALYGFRKSPRLWGCHRDAVLREKTFVVGGQEMRMVQFVSEPNLWKVVRKEDEEQEKEVGIDGVFAMMLIYVDDIFIVGGEEVLKKMMETIQEEWNTSIPEWVGEQPVRFLGMEISRKEEVWMATQRNYIQDLLRRNLGEDEKMWPKRKIPFNKEPPKDKTEEPSPEGVKVAQKIVGELLWLVTRTRPDLMYPVSRLSSATLSQPKWVMETAHQIWGYLASTSEEGIRYEGGSEIEDWEEGAGIEAFADASFAPGGEESHGAVVVTLRGGVLLWKCGRQSTVALSTAEAELNELIEGLMVGESVAAVVEELEPRIPKVMVTDSQAALGICTSEGGSWRTRHLRLRAAHARQRFTRGDWWLKHRGGEDMLADIGTKPLQSTRLSYLKRGLHMGTMSEEQKEEEKAGRSVEEMTGSQQEEIEKVLRMLVMMVTIQSAKAQGERDEEDGGGWMVVAILFFAVIGMFLVVAEGVKKIRRLLRTPEPEEEPQDLPETPRENRESPTFQTSPLPEPGSSGEASERLQSPGESRGASERLQTPRSSFGVSDRLQTSGSRGGASERLQTPGTSERVSERGTTPRSSGRFSALRTPGGHRDSTPRMIDEDIQLTSERFTARTEGSGSSRRANSGGRSSGFVDDLMRSLDEERMRERGRGSNEIPERGGEELSSWANHYAGGEENLHGGVQSPGLRRREIRHLPQPEPEDGRDGGVDLPPPQSIQSRVERRVYITRWGAKFHTSTRCSSLSNSRLEVSLWCPRCVPQGFQEWPQVLYATGAGGQVHLHERCVAYFGGRAYRRCTLCRGMTG